MEWELEKLFPRKIKTGEEMQWEKIMKKLANETKWSSPQYVGRLFKVPISSVKGLIHIFITGAQSDC
ncbi:hypothetical protein chiPu_0005145 [Chiloscyllium punctatum]|uniref:Uncharacterized protein n=1 Tax=Chiloscyllium punctatum TaxID=137246 RepID=A0A401S8K0_CHIPU|nr:hypothetical protein [Chiloscyllium punctatum]